MIKYYTTKAGYKRFIIHLEEVARRYDKIVSTNEESADAGDNSVWHDNFAYEENQRQMHQWARRFKDLEEIKRNMMIVEKDSNPIKVQIGCYVVIYDNSDGIEKKYFIAGYNDGEPEINRVSYTAPIAKALIGAKIGDVRKFKIGNIIKELEVLDILPDNEE
jgi:transcription elongation factor GreB